MDALFEKYMRDVRATRQANDLMQKCIGEKIQPFTRRKREAKLIIVLSVQRRPSTRSGIKYKQTMCNVPP